MDAIINERVLDIGFRADLERKQGFCRRHVAELVPTDRRVTGGILGSSMLLSAVIDRRIGLVRDGVGSRGRRIRVGLSSPGRVRRASRARRARRPSGRRSGGSPTGPSMPAGPTRSARPRSASTTSSCSGTGRAPDRVRPWRIDSSPASRICGGGWTATSHHSSHDRIQLMTDEERTGRRRRHAGPRRRLPLGSAHEPNIWSKSARRATLTDPWSRLPSPTRSRPSRPPSVTGSGPASRRRRRPRPGLGGHLRRPPHAHPRPDRERQDPRRVPVVPGPAGDRSEPRRRPASDPAPSASCTSRRSRR